MNPLTVVASSNLLVRSDNSVFAVLVFVSDPGAKSLGAKANTTPNRVGAGQSYVINKYKLDNSNITERLRTKFLKLGNYINKYVEVVLVDLG